MPEDENVLAALNALAEDADDHVVVILHKFQHDGVILSTV